MEVWKLPVYNKARRLLQQIEASTKKVPRTYRYTYVRELLDKCMLLMKDISFANEYFDSLESRSQFIAKAITTIQEIKITVRVMFDLKLISKKGFAAIARFEAEVSKQLEGWSRQTNENINNLTTSEW